MLNQVQHDILSAFGIFTNSSKVDAMLVAFQKGGIFEWHGR
jgi:hypothetical protein